MNCCLGYEELAVFSALVTVVRSYWIRREREREIDIKASNPLERVSAQF